MELVSLTQRRGLNLLCQHLLTGGDGRRPCRGRGTWRARPFFSSPDQGTGSCLDVLSCVRKTDSERTLGCRRQTGPFPLGPVKTQLKEGLRSNKNTSVVTIIATATISGSLLINQKLHIISHHPHDSSPSSVLPWFLTGSRVPKVRRWFRKALQSACSRHRLRRCLPHRTLQSSGGDEAFVVTKHQTIVSAALARQGLIGVEEVTM